MAALVLEQTNHATPSGASLFRLVGFSGRNTSTMAMNVRAVLYVGAMIAVIAAVDVMFFLNMFWERLLVNIGIVLVFVTFYLRFLAKR